MMRGYAQEDLKSAVRTRENLFTILGTNSLSKPAYVTLFGNIAILKARCPECKFMGIVHDGIMVCCDVSIHKPERYKTKRESEGENKRSYIPRWLKDQILRQQGYRCIYCERRLDGAVFNTDKDKWIALKIHFDHSIAWIYSRDTSAGNLLASCHICNFIKNDLLFDDLKRAKAFIMHRRQIKGYVDEEMS